MLLLVLLVASTSLFEHAVRVVRGSYSMQSMTSSGNKALRSSMSSSSSMRVRRKPAGQSVEREQAPRTVGENRERTTPTRHNNNFTSVSGGGSAAASPVADPGGGVNSVDGDAPSEGDTDVNVPPLSALSGNNGDSTNATAADDGDESKLTNLTLHTNDMAISETTAPTAASATTTAAAAATTSSSNPRSPRNDTSILNATLASWPNVSTYIIHIPKTGGISLRNMLNTDADRINSRPEDRYFICDQGIGYVEDWYAKFKPTYGGRKCAAYMSESHYSHDLASNGVRTFAVIRDPTQHVLSQYFHCTESVAHKREWKFMPTLTEWLENFAVAKTMGNEPRAHDALKTPKAQMKLVHKYVCYNPVSMQSALLGHPTSKDQLRERLDVVGVTSRLETSSCLMTIRLTGIVPNRCDCSVSSSEVTASSGSSLLLSPRGIQPSMNGTIDDGAVRSSSLRRTADARKVDHNVTHHGGTFVASPHQLKLIANITDEDKRLYRWASELFEDDVRSVEEEYGIKLC